MKVVIEFEITGTAFEDDLGGQLYDFGAQITSKILAQMARDPSVVCDALEVDDKLIDLNGNTVGTIKVEET